MDKSKLAELFGLALVLFVTLIGLLTGTGKWGSTPPIPPYIPEKRFPGEDFPLPPPRQTIEGNSTRCPVCGTFVSTELSVRLDLPDGIVHFCSFECRDR